MNFEYNYNCKKEEGKPPKPERLSAMKKSIYESILSLVSSIDTPEAEEVREAVTAELSKGKAKADANRAVYADIHDTIIALLQREARPLTAQEMADETGISRGKIVYGLTNYWSTEVIKNSDGKTTTYTLA